MKNLVKVFLAVSIFLLIGSSAVQAQVANNPIHWGFKKARDGQPPDAGKEREELIEKYGAVYKGKPDKKDIYLTFDNGYENGYTDKILDVLKKEKVPAAFFVTGHYLETAEDQVIRMVEEGHIVGNHSYYHPDLTQVDDERVKRELEKVRKLTYEITGQKHMSYLRPPRGVYSERTLKLAKDAGYTHVFWSLAFVDWHTNQQKGWEYSYNNIMKQIHPGAVLLLHTVSKDNADALEKVIKDLKKDGYTFKSLDDLFASKEFDNPMLHSN
ncbi:delta-lactam-biosynthetic de-N-acetylase [Mesobacillus maritimus]|uniref:delta-lactam-biosynthetic de-N-acetylase n=1 Tax=Mesobacillus maritimus TaxID=1643336 RepID=UPI00203F84C9|nr:delta-lactam-biosynthetic de-N-acetylase [Mesobacillus maritimus]MCM3585546.1 delta-lactam-biosynthetic de-N-acetylase [Mesobacillus maritimus]MCM3669806.1 delta-lactam-biosynthetic de-N-acetylase [Mesobacillus maritimus]